MGILVGAVQAAALNGPLVLMGVTFVLLQVLSPVHEAMSANLGSTVAAWLYDELTASCVQPPGIGHLEDPELTSDLTTARDFDLGMTGPPMFLDVGFIASGLVEMVSGVASAIVLLGFSLWAPVLLLVAWSSTRWLLGRARSGGTGTPTWCGRRSGTPTTRTASPSTRRRRRSSGSSACRGGRSTVSAPGAGDCSSCSTKRPGYDRSLSCSR